jgi:hypothetical protein
MWPKRRPETISGESRRRDLLQHFFPRCPCGGGDDDGRPPFLSSPTRVVGWSVCNAYGENCAYRCEPHGKARRMHKLLFSSFETRLGIDFNKLYH